MLAHKSAGVLHGSRASRLVMCNSVRLAVVGDVHGQWSAKDAAALGVCGADFTLFVGDFGNEAVALVQEIASLDMPKAAILGNHDAWYTMTARPRSRSRSPSPTGEQQLDRVSAQLVALGACHVGFRHMALPLPSSSTPISLVGARPFSKGGKSLRSMREFMSRFGILDMQDSAGRILDVIRQQVPVGHMLLLLGHNGPAGLGDARFNICGCDWLKEAGDHGDPDLAAVLQQLREEQRSPALVVFGHMHHKLHGGGSRQMVAVDEQTCTVFLNAATVPRVLTHHVKVGAGGATRPGSKHHFLLVDLEDGQVRAAADVWVQVVAHEDSAAQAAAAAGTAAAAAAPVSGNGSGSSSSGGDGRGRQQQQLAVQEQELQSGEWIVQVCDTREVFRTLEQRSDGSRQVELWDAHAGVWRTVLLPPVPRQPAAVTAGPAGDVAGAAAVAAAGTGR